MEHIRKFRGDGSWSGKRDAVVSVAIERIEEAIDSGATTIASACPFCLTMMSDGIKEKNQEQNIKTKDIVEILAENIKSKK